MVGSQMCIGAPDLNVNDQDAPSQDTQASTWKAAEDITEIKIFARSNIAGGCTFENRKLQPSFETGKDWNEKTVIERRI